MRIQKTSSSFLGGESRVVNSTMHAPDRDRTYASAAASVRSSSRFTPAFRAIALAGLLAGSLDLATAFVEAGLEGRTPISLLQGIAGGLLGMETFQGGLGSAALGAFFHFLIA